MNRPRTVRRLKDAARRGAAAASRHVPLPLGLRVLRVLARVAPSHSRATTFARDSLGLRGPALRAWFERAWWGHHANTAVGVRLDRHEAREVDPLLDPIDWAPIDRLLDARRGLIFLGAHLGPGRLTPVAIARRFPDALFVFWNQEPSVGDHRVLVVSRPEIRKRLLVDCLAEVRRGGVVFLPAVGGGGGREPVRQRVLDGTVAVSGSAAALARLSGAPCVPVASEWADGRMRVRFGNPIRPSRPDPAGWETEFHAAWGKWLEGWLTGPPENLGLRQAGFFPTRD